VPWKSGRLCACAEQGRRALAKEAGNGEAREVESSVPGKRACYGYCFACGEEGDRGDAAVPAGHLARTVECQDCERV
jgi:NAD(P)H-hydrate repair Nnr-like enzyme with NAD(P)H-hydrate epimerase domain